MTATRTPLQDLPMVRCEDCRWERRAFHEHLRELTQLGLQHITETDGHQVFIVNPELPA